MINLIKNEVFKAFKQKKLYVFMLLILFMVIAVGINYKLNMSDYAPMNTNGQSLPIYLIGGMQQIVIIFLGVYIADNLCGEYKNGTLKLPLLRSVKRVELLNAKILSLLLLIVIMTTFLIVTSYIIGSIVLGFGNGLLLNGIAYNPGEGILLTMLAALASLFPVMGFAMVLICISLLLTDMALTIVIAVALMLADRFFETFVQIKEYLIIYQMYFFPLNSTVYFTWENTYKSIGIITGYIVIFYICSAMLLKKKDILL
jgi:ABC-type transport system involved in multi-copper enzyme maturation permease subunit